MGAEALGGDTGSAYLLPLFAHYLTCDRPCPCACPGPQQMGNFNEWEAANTIWAYGKMNYSPGEEWLNKFVFW